MEFRHGPHLSHMSDRDYHVQIIQHLTARLRDEPGDRRAFFLRGNAYLDSGDFRAAVDDYGRAIALQPDAVAYNNRGIAYRNLKDAGLAMADFLAREADDLKSDPDFAVEVLSAAHRLAVPLPAAVVSDRTCSAVARRCSDLVAAGELRQAAALLAGHRFAIVRWFWLKKRAGTPGSDTRR